MPTSRTGLDNPNDPDTIRILVATDSHVGYNERDVIRGDDSWKTFHEVMTLAKKHDVDMVLHGGDLFHENKPSRKSLYQVMRSLRMNCLGDRPCQLEMLSDASENFQGAFNHVNYEDPDINVSIPVFSIHGNHDDPSGEGHYSAMDILQISGLVNYYGRTPESDNIQIKPVLLQKGHTKLALFGMSNVRDERLFRTFRDGNVKFFRPSVQQDDWFNLMSVHQNHHAHTDTGYLPESFLPDFLDLVVWGHEHECLIEPTLNDKTGFHVMQPGSSVATSLMPGEAVPKHVAILSVNTKEQKKFEVTPIRLKTVRPFVMKEIVLSEEKALKDVARKDSNRSIITRHLMGIVDSLIKQAKKEWLQAQDPPEDDEPLDPPLPLIRLRVEYTAPDGGRYDCENPQRFSNRFVDKVANVNDVVQFYRKKAYAKKQTKNSGPTMPDESVLAQMNVENVKVEKLVREFLMAQSLTILPANSFGDAVSQFVDKDDNKAMEIFVNDALAEQMQHLLATDDMEEDEIAIAMENYRSKLEEMFAAGQRKTRSGRKLKPKPDNWDSDLEGPWEEQPAALEHDDLAEDGDSSRMGSVPPRGTATRGRGRGRGGTAPRAATSKAPAKTTGRGKRKVMEEDEDEDNDVIMLDDDDEEEEESDAEDLFTRPAPPKKTTARREAMASKATASKAAITTARSQRASSPAVKKAPAARPAARQTTLNFSQTADSLPGQTGRGTSRRKPPSDDEISDDDDAFEPAAPPSTRSRR
ncbi:double-strand break repair protein mus-23 [Macrophomina phaseolina]|uniref:Double-strand break repair protein n=1 Tax=Macrophomina phaseolina TaxID=35725 RepID=A0ABQ8GG13_9PEZI|nr:double-strand break repair protein mus-23 [Macrophomina phaseolina]